MMSDDPASQGFRFWKRSLVARLVVYFLVLFLAAVVLLDAIVFQQVKRALEQSVMRRLEVAAALKKDALIHWLDEQRRDFFLLANLQVIRDGSAELLRRPKADPRFIDAYNSLDGVVSPLAKRKDWQEVLILSEKSEILFSSEKSHEGDHRVADRFFVEGRKGPYFEKVYLSPFTAAPTMTFSLPAGDDGTGVIAIHLDVEAMNRIIVERTVSGDDRKSYLVDRSRTPLFSEGFGREGFPGGVRSVGINRALDHMDGSGLYDDYKGTPVIGVYRWIEDMEVALVIEAPQDSAFAPARRILWLIVAVGAAVAAILALGTFLLARRIAGPVLRITDAALRVAEGDLKTRVPVVTDDEIGMLARTFNRMTEALECETADRIRAQREREVLITELEERNAELERFTYTVSHDLKSPLVTIRGFLGMLVKDLEAGRTEQVNRDVEHILAASDTMRQLLEELLDLARIGRQLNLPQDVALDELVRQALESVAGRILERGVRVTVQPDLGIVHGDRMRFLEVFQNLVENAVNFMGDQLSPSIEIGSRPDDDPEEPGEWLLCYVRDNGIGIEPCYHEQVFRLFERLDSTTPGTGIGLALVKRIVELHGGRIRIESTAATAGTTFFFTLPRLCRTPTQLEV